MAGVATAALSRTEKVFVAIIGGGALLSIPAAAWALVASAVALTTEASVRVAGVHVVNSAYPPFLAASDAPVDAGYETAWVEVANLPGGARWLLWIEAALPMLLALGIAIAVALLAFALLRGAPFARGLPAMLGVVAIAVVASGLGTQVVGAIARAETVAFLGVGKPVGDPAEGLAVFSATLDPSPFAWGLGIGLVAAAFSIGTRLQRDTRGLV